MSLIVDFEATLNAEFVGIVLFMIYRYTRFHMPIFNGSLVLASKRKAKCRFLTAAILLLYVLQKIFLNKSCIIVKFIYHTSFNYLILSGASVPSTS